MALLSYFRLTVSASLKTICLIMLCIICNSVSAQKENYVWYFGQGVGLDFKTTPPTALQSSFGSLADCASVSDAQGNFLFFTDGVSVYDKTHARMPNGNGLNGSLAGWLGLQQTSIAVIKKPGSNHLYYIFTVGVTQIGTSSMLDGSLYYHIVDIDLNNGKGDVVVKNVPLLQHNVTTKVVMVKDAYGCGFWLIAQRFNNGTYYSFHINGSGINTTPVESVTGCAGVSILASASKISPDKKRFVSITYERTPLGNSRSRTELFDFDNLTGKLSNCRVTDTLAYRFFGLSFSPNSRFLYLATPYSNPAAIYQFDVSLPTANAVMASKTTIFLGLNPQFGAMQLGPDNRIYITQPSRQLSINYMSVINYPDNKGLACGFSDSGFLLSTNAQKYYSFYNLPNLIESARPFNLEFELGKDSVLCTGQKFEIDGAKYIDGNFLWSTGETTKTITVDKPGLYKLTISSLCGTYTDSVNIKVGKPFTVYLGNDTAFCGPFRHLLDARKGAKNYLWNTGDTTVTLLVDKPNIYAVAVKDTDNCNTGDTIDIGQLNKPVIDLRLDTVTCQYVSLSIPKQDSVIKHQWSTGDTNLAITVTKKGNYTVTLSNRFCSISSSMLVDKLPKPDVDLGPDTSICDGNPVVLNAGNDGKRVWNTKDTSAKITVNKEGTYSVTVSRNNCSATDSIWVGPICDMWYYIPTAFTPGRDATNDVFEVSGEYLKHVDMKIFDRWGELIYSGSGVKPSWDGSFKSSACPGGAYMYMVSVTGYKNGRLRKENLSGTVTLLR